MKTNLRELYCAYRSAEAFWAAADDVMTDSCSQKMFLRIANVQNHIVQLHEDIDRIKELADNGNPYMQYAFARLHDTLALEAGSSEICEKYYGLALNAGLPMPACSWHSCTVTETLERWTAGNSAAIWGRHLRKAAKGPRNSDCMK